MKASLWAMKDNSFTPTPGWVKIFFWSWRCDWGIGSCGIAAASSVHTSATILRSHPGTGRPNWRRKPCYKFSWEKTWEGAPETGFLSLSLAKNNRLEGMTPEGPFQNLGNDNSDTYVLFSHPFHPMMRGKPRFLKLAPPWCLCGPLSLSKCWRRSIGRW